MKRITSLVLSLCLLSGCGVPSIFSGGSATAETAAPTLPPAPAAAEQTLTVCNAAGRAHASFKALEAYAEAQGVTLEYTEDLQQADLVVSCQAPADDGSWYNLASDSLLSAAASKAGLDPSASVTALPLGKTLYAYWADSRLLNALLGEGCISDLQNASWEEWSGFVEALAAWITEPAETSVTLNGTAYTLPTEVPAEAQNLTGIFALPVDGGYGSGGGPLYTAAVLPAGSEPTAETLEGPLTGLWSALELEFTNATYTATPDTEDWNDIGIWDVASCSQLLSWGNAVFLRASLSDILANTDADFAQNLVAIPVKGDYLEEDLATDEYNLAGLMNYPTLAMADWLAIPASADEEGRKAASSAILWLYTDGDAQKLLTETLCMITPWGTASDATTLGAQQVAQVSTGILPAAEVQTTAGADVWRAHTEGDWGTEDRDAFVQASTAALLGNQ